LSKIDELLEGLNGDVRLALTTEHQGPVECRLMHMNDYGGGLLDVDQDFAIITRKHWADFAMIGEQPYTSRIAEMPVSHNPDHPDIVRHGWTFWPIRGEGDCPQGITGLTIHHTCSHSPLALAGWTTRRQENGGKGMCSIQYHFWVSQGDGCPVWQLAPLEWALWSDHTGPFQTTLSVGMAGRLHESHPPDEQIAATVKLVVYLQRRLDIPIAEVKGHCERYHGTECPGWNYGWKAEFYEALENAQQ